MLNQLDLGLKIGHFVATQGSVLHLTYTLVTIRCEKISFNDINFLLAHDKYMCLYLSY